MSLLSRIMLPSPSDKLTILLLFVFSPQKVIKVTNAVNLKICSFLVQFPTLYLIKSSVSWHFFLIAQIAKGVLLLPAWTCLNVGRPMSPGMNIIEKNRVEQTRFSAFSYLIVNNIVKNQFFTVLRHLQPSSLVLRDNDTFFWRIIAIFEVLDVS